MSTKIQPGQRCDHGCSGRTGAVIVRVPLTWHRARPVEPSGRARQEPHRLPPAISGNPEIKLIATDPEGNSDTATLLLSVVSEINDAPQIVNLEKNPAYVAPGGVVQLTCVAHGS